MASLTFVYHISLLALVLQVVFARTGNLKTGGRILPIEDFGAISDAVAFDDEILWTFHDLEESDTDFIDDTFFGALSSKISAVSLNNTEAFNMAIQEARPGDTVLVPDGKSFTMLGGIQAENKHHITIDIAGSMHFAYDKSAWPFSRVPRSLVYPTRWGYDPCLAIYNSTFISITSSSEARARVKVNYHKNMVYLVDSDEYRGGIVNGNGKLWWDDAIKGNLPNHGDSRPKLIHVMESENIFVEKLTLLNSAFWSLTVEAIVAEVSEINVLIDRMYQTSLFTKQDAIERVERRLGSDVKIPFPIDDLPDWVGRRLRQPEDLNTDGIDPSGHDIWIHNCIVQNADDSVAIKSSKYVGDLNSRMPSCTRNVTVENMVLTGFGASIGSVTPDPRHSCVDSVTFRNISMPGTGKGIYIKSDGSDCNGGVSSQITNILYDGVHMHTPFWWPLWIGPQQQHQPHTDLGLKCPLTYPLPGSTKCPTQGCTDFANITLRNIVIVNPLISPGVILGNETNPIKNLTIENLHVKISKSKPWHGKWPYHEKRYPWRGRIKCINTTGECKNCDPPPHCLVKV